MAGSSEGDRFEKGLSTRYLLMVFLAGVAVCAVFFSLGFLVGYNERSSKVVPLTENITGSSSVIPPTVNPPAGAPGSSASAPSPTPPSGPPDQISTESVQLEQSAKAQAPSPVKPLLAETASAPPPSSNARTASSPAPSGAPPSQGLAVQVTALRAKSEAAALVKTLKGRGFSAYLVTPQAAHAGDRLYRVHVGPFATRQEAEKVMARLSKQGYKPFIKH